MEPTSFTCKAVPFIKEAFNLIDEAFDPIEFNSYDYQKPISIALHISSLECHGKRIYSSLRKRFPLAQIRLLCWGESTERELLEGDLDLGIHLLDEHRSQEIYQQLLIRDTVGIGVHQSHSQPSWNEVVHWPFVILRTTGWNDTRLRFIEMLRKNGVNIHLRSIVDSAAIGQEILREERAACIIPQSLLPEDFHFINTPQQYHFDLGMVACYPRTKRGTPLINCLVEEILAVIQ